MPRLIMRRGPTPGAVYDLDIDEITIGRGRRNQIVIHDNEVSREHCRLIRLMDDYEVHDLNSSNGTFVNGLRVINNWLLQPGSLVELGDSITLEYERTGAGGTGSLNHPTQTQPLPLRQEEAETPDDCRHVLMMTMGPTVGRVYYLSDPLHTIGRDAGNDIIIQDPEISRNHVRLRRVKNDYVVEDTGSTNGTYINGALLNEPHSLATDDVLRLGTAVQLQYILQTNADAYIAVDPSPAKRATGEYTREELGFTSFINPVPAQRKVSRLGTGLQPGALEDHVMISYSRDAWESVVANLTLSLQDAGLNVWVDQYLVQGSEDWRAAVEQALLECWAMVIVVSPNSLNSNYVKMEYRHFINREKPVVPLIYQPVTPLPAELSRLRTISYDGSNPRKTFHKLIFEIMQLRR
ncbi:MAG: FHA domain-containing protein [bacterium]|nr:FHA domain-containing protein [bacterium]